MIELSFCLLLNKDLIELKRVKNFLLFLIFELNNFRGLYFAQQ